MTQKIVTILCLAFFSLACMSMAGAASIDAAAPVGTSPTLTNPSATADTETQTMAPTETQAQRCAVVVADEALHLRESASESSLVLTWLNHGVVVDLVENSDPNWWHVRFGKFEGFARSAYLVESECVK